MTWLWVLIGFVLGLLSARGWVVWTAARKLREKRRAFQDILDASWRAREAGDDT